MTSLLLIFLGFSLIRVQGLGITLVAARQAGVDVTLVDTSQASIDKGLKFAGKQILCGSQLSRADSSSCRKITSQRCLKRTHYPRTIRQNNIPDQAYHVDGFPLRRRLRN